LVGLGSAPVLLLLADLPDDVPAAAPVFWAGVGLMTLGFAVVAIQLVASSRLHARSKQLG